MRKLSIPRRSSIVLVFAAILATFSCTRASSPPPRTRSLKPILSAHPFVSSKPAVDESPMRAFLPIEAW